MVLNNFPPYPTLYTCVHPSDTLLYIYAYLPTASGLISDKPEGEEEEEEVPDPVFLQIILHSRFGGGVFCVHDVHDDLLY